MRICFYLSVSFSIFITAMKTVLITGATSGIGEACALKFAQNGYNVIACGRNKEKLSQMERQLAEQYSVKVYTLCFDICNAQEVRSQMQVCFEQYPPVDVLINNAGLALGLDKQHEGAWEDFNTMIDTNIKGLLLMSSLVVPKMVERGKGHIINIGSVAGDAAYAGGSIYCATKAAVKALTDGLRIDLVDTPIRVTNIKPGLVETNFSNIRFKGDTQRADNVYKGIKALTGEDIADVAYYAASAPAHVQIAEVLVLATHQASGTVVHRE